ncbi:hypothetical protein G9A89_010217 [Geosiphon pyriformis]|nr:hypothetical protein G9A89_010217 [Geosiphon pyriformis]
MSFYLLWYLCNVCKRASKQSKLYSTLSKNGLTLNQARADFTPAQVTLQSNKDSIVYRLEFKSTESLSSNIPCSISSSRSSIYSGESMGYSQDGQGGFFEWSDGFKHYKSIGSYQQTRSHKRRLTKDSESLSTSSFVSRFSQDSMWEDWIVKYIRADDKLRDEHSLEDWIFDTIDQKD